LSWLLRYALSFTVSIYLFLRICSED
jgi:hypothetical protein